jgi:hypothetical protein
VTEAPCGQAQISLQERDSGAGKEAIWQDGSPAHFLRNCHR